MVTLETAAHVGSDGILSLRLETPSGMRNQDVRVVLLLQEEPSAKTGEAKATASAANLDERLRAAGIVSPPKGPWNAVHCQPPELPGPTISETLVNERR